MTILLPPSFAVKLSGKCYIISQILNKVDPTNGPIVYPLHCLDGYHFEDATVTISVDERGDMTLGPVTKSNIRGSL